MVADIRSMFAKSGVSTGVGSLPHRDSREAAAFSLAQTPELPCIPTLPRRSPAEGMIAQAVVGIPGISLGQYGSLLVDSRMVHPLAAVRTSIDDDAFGALRAFIELAQDHQGPVKWQFTGPITLGWALVRAGVAPHLAFDVAVRAVREHVRVLCDHIGSSLPNCPQIVILDEPELGDLLDENHPLALDSAIDILSGAMAAVERDAVVGIHSCGSVPLAPLIAAGPRILSIPASEDLVAAAPQINAFLESGGWIAWGVVPTDGPLGTTVERWWRRLSSVWCGLVQSGCDAMRLRQQSFVTPDCGLALHDSGSAQRVFEQVREIGEKVRTQALATRLTVGA
jgi:methionine synthase II (cobalamin-independent)